jgi:alpha-glucosidase (family GH31 glycosyl hydrolase)
VSNLPGLKHLPWLNYLYYKNSQKDGKRGLAFSRWGGWGDQRHPIHFSGDTVANWETLAFEIEFTSVSGNAGCFFWAHDIGGFYGERDPELYTRWVQFGALSSSLRLHSCGDNLDRRPWKWGTEFEDSMRKSYHLRVELMPYVYTSASQCYRFSQPLIRGMYMGWPAEDAAYEQPQQYQFGDHFLVSPITSPGTGNKKTSNQQMWLPPSHTWCNWFSKERVAGGKTLQVETDLDSFPLFVRAGALIPTTQATQLRLKGFAPDKGDSVCSELYEDDGQSNQYLSGIFALTEFVFSNVNEYLEINIGKKEGKFETELMDRYISIEAVMTDKPSRCTLNEKDILFDYTDDTLILQLGTVAANQEQIIKVYI